METAEITEKRTRYIPTMLLVFSIIFSFYYIEVGFALKPFMILILVFFTLSLKQFVVHKLRTYEVAMLIFFGYYCSTGFLARFPEYSLRMTLGVLLVLFCYFVMRYILSLASTEDIEKVISFAGIVFNLLSLILYFIGIFSLGFNLSGNQVQQYGVELDRGFPRLIGLASDPNIFCFYNILFFFYFLTHLKEKRSKFGFVLTSITMLMTLSRGGILAVVFGLVLMFLSTNLRKKIQMLIILPLSVFVMNFLLKTFMNLDIIGMVTDRFLADDGGSGRSTIWGMGLRFFQENPVFGVGIFNYRPYSMAEYGYAVYMHNTYLEALVEGGVIGITLYLMIFIIFIITYWNNRALLKDHKYLLFSFVSIAVMMATYSFMINEVFFLVLALFWRYLYEIKHPNSGEVIHTKRQKKKRKPRKKYKVVWSK